MNNKKKEPSPKMQRMRGKAVMSVCYRNGKSSLEWLFQEGAARLFFPHGDSLEWEIRLQRDTDVTLTTQAAEKIYRAIDKTTPATVDVHLSIAEQSRLCWLPQETIIFNHSALQRKLDVNMKSDSEFLLSEIIVFGRKLMGESVEKAFLRDNWIIRRNSEIIHAEALHLGPDIGQDIATPAFLNGGGAMANLLLIAPYSERVAERARTIVNDMGGISSWNGKLLARMVCRDCYALHKRLVALVSLLNHKAGIPKMWSI